MLKRTFPITAALTALAGPAIAAGLHCPMVRINGLMIGPDDVYPTGDERAIEDYVNGHPMRCLYAFVGAPLTCRGAHYISNAPAVVESSDGDFTTVAVRVLLGDYEYRVIEVTVRTTDARCVYEPMPNDLRAAARLGFVP